MLHTPKQNAARLRRLADRIERGTVEVTYTADETAGYLPIVDEALKAEIVVYRPVKRSER